MKEALDATVLVHVVNRDRVPEAFRSTEVATDIHPEDLVDGKVAITVVGLAVATDKAVLDGVTRHHVIVHQADKDNTDDVSSRMRPANGVAADDLIEIVEAVADAVVGRRVTGVTSHALDHLSGGEIFRVAAGMQDLDPDAHNDGHSLEIVDHELHQANDEDEALVSLVHTQRRNLRAPPTRKATADRQVAHRREPSVAPDGADTSHLDDVATLRVATSHMILTLRVTLERSSLMSSRRRSKPIGRRPTVRPRQTVAVRLPLLRPPSYQWPSLLPLMTSSYVRLYAGFVPLPGHGAAKLAENSVAQTVRLPA